MRRGASGGGRTESDVRPSGGLLASTEILASRCGNGDDRPGSQFYVESGGPEATRTHTVDNLHINYSGREDQVLGAVQYRFPTDLLNYQCAPAPKSSSALCSFRKTKKGAERHETIEKRFNLNNKPPRAERGQLAPLLDSSALCSRPATTRQCQRARDRAAAPFPQQQTPSPKGAEGRSLQPEKCSPPDFRRRNGVEGEVRSSIQRILFSTY